jgi:hypothetical protein
MLTIHGYGIPSNAVTNDFYRQALDLSLQSKQEFSSQLLTAMGGISRFQFSRYKTLLKLSDEALELADRYNVDEKKLRYVTGLSQEYHTEIVRQIIDLNLTSKQVRDICETEITEDSDKAKDEGEVSIPRPAMQIARATRNSNEMSGIDLANALLRQEHDTNLARVRLQMIRRLIDEAEKHLQSE